MATFSRVILSGSTNGRVVPVAATSTPGTTVHTSVAGSNDIDEIFLWASNVTGAAATLTVEYGGVTDPGDHLVKGYSIPANSLPVLIADGLQLQNSLVVRAFSDTGSAINISGYVNRITA